MFDRAIEDLTVLTGNIIEDLFYIIGLGYLIWLFVGLIDIKKTQEKTR